MTDYKEIVQGSQEWLEARLGFCTASRVSDALAGKDTETRKNYLWQLVAERLTKTPQASFAPNAAMLRGVEQEPVARAAYEAHSGVFVDQVAFVPHATIKWLGASPDGLVGDDGLVEIKNPNTATHLQYRKAGKVPTKYKNQMMLQLACTQRKWCDFVSFDSRLPTSKMLFIVRFEPKQDEIDEMLDKIQVFLSEVEAECDD
jgi:putative phage-type endonuclease